MNITEDFQENLQKYVKPVKFMKLNNKYIRINIKENVLDIIGPIQFADQNVSGNLEYEYYLIEDDLDYRLTKGEVVVFSYDINAPYVFEVVNGWHGCTLSMVNKYKKFVVKNDTEEVVNKNNVLDCIPKTIKPITKIRKGEIYITHELDEVGLPVVKYADNNWTYGYNDEHIFRYNNIKRYKIKGYYNPNSDFVFDVHPNKKIVYVDRNGKIKYHETDSSTLTKLSQIKFICELDDESNESIEKHDDIKTESLELWSSKYVKEEQSWRRKSKINTKAPKTVGKYKPAYRKYIPKKGDE